MSLPKVLNLNPRSAMNKICELQDFILEEEIDCAFISESHETQKNNLENCIKLDDHTVISNVYQRKEKGGRPALIINHKKYNIEDLTNTVVQIPWGVEVAWALLTPKNVTRSSLIQNIVVGSIYVKPTSKKKKETLDHIALTYNFLSVKYGKGLYWILAGDTNDLKLDPILDLNSNLKSVVKKPTRLNPDSILDNIITDLSNWYQEPLCLPPLNPDVGSNGAPSDHLTVVMEPISAFNNNPARTRKEVEFRPIRQSGIDLFHKWINEQTWTEIYEAQTVDEKTEIFQNMLMAEVERFFPKVKKHVTSDDQPFCNEKIKKLKRSKAREYRKSGKSKKWFELNKKYKKEVSKAKQSYYRNIVEDLKVSNPAKWYSSLKRLCSYDQMKSESIDVESIKNLSTQEQAEKIADSFSAISLEYDPLDAQSIEVPSFDVSDIPQFSPRQVAKEMTKIKTNKAVPPGDVPAKLIKVFAKELAVPFSHILNKSLMDGTWSRIYKLEIVTPVPKVFPPKTIDQLRNISGLLTFNKIAEKLIGELIIADMTKNLDAAQYANQKSLSLNHYLVKMLDRILTDIDKRSKDEINAVIATFYDWKQAFPRQCPKLGIEAFIKCGVRPSLIPILISYFQGRRMKVKWHGVMSSERKLNGSVPQGSTFGIWQYLGSSDKNADVVDSDYKFKFVDDLSVLEKINLLTIGLASWNSKSSVSSDLPEHNQIIPAENLRSQHYLNEINKWTNENKCILNQKKTQVMIFNFNEKYQFSTRLSLNNENLEVVNRAKILGLIITDDLKWDENTSYLVKKAYSRMQLLRKVSSFTRNTEDLRKIYILYIRSILEQSCVVWHSSLTEENKENLERVQKAAVRLILGRDYENYEDALDKLNLQSLEERRRHLSLKFAENCLKNPKVANMFPLKQNKHEMDLRNSEKFEVKHARTERLKHSAIPMMQRMLNDKSRKKEA